MAEDIDEIKQRLDIVEVIQSYVPLKRAGSSFKGLCPFHQEKSPSFMVTPAKQRWHCFGTCGEGGDVFTFIQKIEGLSFYDTKILLAERTGVKIQKRFVKPGETPDVKDRLRELLDISTKFFHKILTDHPKAQIARDYVKKRELLKETVDAFQLGYAPESWDTLTKFLDTKGFTKQEMVASGMVIFNQERKSYYDRFRNRFMIPLRDTFGNVVGFTARAIGENYDGGKYINTPQTMLYDKSKVVFGLYEAKQAIKDAGYAVIVEGNMDVISSHQAGVKPVVAISGTAFTKDQIDFFQMSILKRFTPTLIFSFDADAAGMAASRKGVELALKNNMQVKMLVLPFGKDPDECIKKDVNAWKQAIADARPMLEEIIRRSVKKHDPYSAQGKKAIQEDVLSVMSYVSNDVEIAHYIRILSDEIQTPSQILFEELEKIKKQPRKTEQKAQAPSGTHPSAAIAMSEEQRALFEHLAIAALQPLLFTKLEFNHAWLAEGDQLAELYKTLNNYYSSNTTGATLPNLQAFITSLAPAMQELFVRIQLFGDKEFAELPPDEQRATAQARLIFLKKQHLRREMGRIQSALKDAERAGDDASMQQHMRLFSDVSQQLAQLE